MTEFVKRKVGALKTDDRAASLDERVESQRARLDAQAERLNNQAERLNSQAKRLDAYGARLDTAGNRLETQYNRLETQRERIEKLEATVRKWASHVGASRVAVDVLQHQVSSMELRIEDVRAEFEAIPSGDDQARDQAREIVAAMRSEHAQVRAELQLLAAYEERIRRIEDVLVAYAESAPLPEMDLPETAVATEPVAETHAPAVTEES